MTRKTIPVLLVVIAMVGSGPALAVSTGSSDTAATDTVIVQNAQADSLQLENATVENVTIRELRIDSLTIQNQTDGNVFNVTEGEEAGPVVLQNVHFQNLSLENASIEGLNVSGQAAPTGIGNVSSVVIAEMTVGNLTVQEANVSEGGGNGIVSGIVDRISGLFGGDGEQAANETQPDLRIGSVDVEQMSVDQLTVEQFEEVQDGGMAANETANETQADGAANATVLGQVTAENASIDTVAAERMVAQEPQPTNETETPTEPTTPAANETTPSET